MAAEVKKEIQLETAHVLFIDIVGYSKLSINEQGAAVDELSEVVRSSDQYQKAEAAGRLIKIPTGDGMALVFTPVQKRQHNAQLKSVASSKSIHAYNFGWACTAVR
jgi:hypothetical protein